MYGTRGDDASREDTSDATRAASKAAPLSEMKTIIDPIPEPRQKNELPPTLHLAWIGLLGGIHALLFLSLADASSGLASMVEVFDESLCRLITWMRFVIFILAVPVCSILGLYDRIHEWRTCAFVAVTMLSLAVAHGYCFASIGIDAYMRVSSWQEHPYPFSVAEENMKATYDRAYCVHVGRETCEDMRLKDATPLFNLTEWTKSSWYSSVEELCHANPDNGLAVCKSCEAVRQNADWEDEVSLWVVENGDYEAGVEWCASYFGTDKDPAEGLRSAPYNYRRTWFLKHVAQRTMYHTLSHALFGALAFAAAFSLFVINIRGWWQSRKKSGGTDTFQYAPID